MSITGIYELTILNRGHGDASDIRIHLEGVPIEEHDTWESEQGHVDATLYGQAETIYRLHGYPGGSSPPWPLRIEWKDATGEQQTDITLRA